MLTGAPGAAGLYAVLAAGAWPSSGRAEQRPARWLLVAWAALWAGGAGLELLSAQSGAPDAIAARASVQLAVGLGALAHRSRLAALGLGGAISAGYWIAGQGLGQLSSGQATDPNTGPLLVLMAIALWSWPSPARAPVATNQPARTRTL